MRVLEHIVAVIGSEAMQGLLRCQVVQPGEGEDLARAVILPGFVLYFSVAKCGGGEVVMRIDHRDGGVKRDAVGSGFESLQKLFHER